MESVAAASLLLVLNMVTSIILSAWRFFLLLSLLTVVSNRCYQYQQFLWLCDNKPKLQNFCHTHIKILNLPFKDGSVEFVTYSPKAKHAKAKGQV